MKVHLVLLTLFFSFIFYGQSNSNLTYKEQLKQSKSNLVKSSITDFDSILHNNLVNNVFSYWYGTTWDYNGYTNTPNKGEIACGYFVSTTLKHIGFNLNRYDIAKMYSSDIVKVLCNDAYETYTEYDDFTAAIRKQPDGIYILGLSNHIGFLEIVNGEHFFIHSDYMHEDGVRKEKCNQSESIKYSDTFWLGKFSTNKSTFIKYRDQNEYKRI